MLYEEKDGGLVVVANLTWVGPVKPCKVSSGKGQNLIEKTVYNFYMKSGFQSFQSHDFNTQDEAEEDHADIIRSLDDR